MQTTTHTITDRNILTVSQLNQQARLLLEGRFAIVWVEAEISNLVKPVSGHWYFTLKDAQAQVRCAMFRGQNSRLAFNPENGMQVLARAKVSLYEGRGDFQLIVESIEPTGDGKLRRAFEMLQKKLFAEGLFASEHKKALPRLPRQIGVITSATGAAIRDVLKVLKQRFPSIPVIIYPSQVQGEKAAAELVSALAIANQRNECDVLLLVRGGGSLEDLWPFNEEIVARAIYASDIPIISGVGHEIDFTIADQVADHRAPTPSAAAEMVSPDQREYLRHFLQITQRLAQLINRHLQQCQQTLMNLRKRLQHPGQRLQQQAQHLDIIEIRLRNALQTIIHRAKQQLAELSRALDAVSPLATLNRGYSISRKTDGTVIHNINQINIGEKITTQVAKGEMICIVDKLSK